MRLLVTGAGGGLGRALTACLPDTHDVADRDHRRLPVEDADAVLDAVLSFRPKVVFHLAAMTAVDACEADPDAAFRVNALGTANVARASARAGALLVALSTDYVFDGTKGEPYHEFDEPRPLSVYGRSKLAGEREARILAPEHLIVRTAWVYGAPGDFVSESVRRLAAGERVGGIVDRWGSPTHVNALAERLLPLARSGRRGIVHVAGPQRATWFDVLVRARDLGALAGEVVEQKAEDLGRPAPRPADSSLGSIVHTGIPPMPSLDESLREVLKGVGGES